MATHLSRHVSATLAVLVLATLIPAQVDAQEPPVAAATHRVTVTGGIDFLNAYVFRGLRQDDTGLITWPHVEVGVGVYSGDGALKKVTAYGGSWNSLHTGLAGSDGPSGGPWYESDVRAGVHLTFAGVLADASYTAYKSPNSMFTAMKEVAIRVAADDRLRFGSVPLRPYALAAVELDTVPGIGQADGGFEAGRYLEVGAAPGFTAGALDVAVPVKVGFSLGSYYELAGTDHAFGFSSVSGVVTIPIGRRTSAGVWNIHGGVEYLVLGETTTAFNNGERTQAITSIGIGWSR